MPALVQYFAALIFLVFGVGFYFALLNFRKWSDKEASDSEALEKNK